MACQFVGFVAAMVLVVLQSGQGVLASGTPQPEQIHISSTGGGNNCDVVLLNFIGSVMVVTGSLQPNDQSKEKIKSPRVLID